MLIRTSFLDVYQGASTGLQCFVWVDTLCCYKPVDKRVVVEIAEAWYDSRLQEEIDGFFCEEGMNLLRNNRQVLILVAMWAGSRPCYERSPSCVATMEETDRQS